MNTLSICIPNYDRIEKLERLVRESARQISGCGLEDEVQICISDDCSPENPNRIVKKISAEYPQVEILFERNQENKGMDYNFLNSVMMASSEYCWIIGNDDMPTDDGLIKIMQTLKAKENIDILLTPFDTYDDNDNIRGTIYPLKQNIEKLFDTSVQKQYLELLLSVRHNSGLFGFLSNVVFKRMRWVEYRERFKYKMNTIFIQMYMNIETLKNGAVYLYIPEKIIKNYADDETNETIDRICSILFGLDGVVEYFFEGEEKEHLKRIIVDAYISGKVWGLPDGTLYKEDVRKIISPKNQLYKKYFVPAKEREAFYFGKKFIIYGTGKYGQEVCKELRTYNAAIIGAADSDHSKKGTDFEGFPIMSINEMIEQYRKQDAYILVANYSSLEVMVNTLLENEVGRIGIIN